jgi:pimeloyl-ACP methyl ester carboxylesterase
MITLVLLPGMDGTGALFAPFVTALGNEIPVKVVAYPAGGPLKYPELEAIARAALPTDGPFVLLGESFSGPIAIALAAAHPPGLKGLVLCCTFCRNPRPALALLKSLAGLIPFALAPMRVVSFFLLGRFVTAALRTSLKQALAIVAPSVLRARLRAVLSVDVSAMLADVAVPTLYLRAAHDRLIPQAAASLVTEHCAQANIVTIDAPHLLLQALPVEAARAVANFLRQLN